MKVAGLFAGIAGLELGLGKSGHETALFCEIDDGAIQVLSAHFPQIPIHSDVTTLVDLPGGIDLITAGFPCQDLSQAGLTLGLNGIRSSLVNQVFRIISSNDVPNLLIENVPFMLQLNRGHAMLHIINELERLGYKWAYRVVDAQSFGLPQRRLRVYIFASKIYEPWKYIFKENAAEPSNTSKNVAYGFYWTEGRRGLGWAINAVPTLKGGSTIGIASPPAIWLPDNRIVVPTINDVERLQGFEKDWTLPSNTVAKKGHRWKLVGNAVSVKAAEWAGKKLAEMETSPRKHTKVEGHTFDQTKAWPKAAFGGPGLERLEVQVSTWAKASKQIDLIDFIDPPTQLLSNRALSGFLKRLDEGSLRFPNEFRDACIAQRERTAPTTRTA